MYRTVSFRCDHSMEWEYDDHGDPVTPGGRWLAEAIAASLTTGPGTTSEVHQHEDYGWAFTCCFGKDSFYQVLNAVDEDVYFTIEMEWYLIKKLLLRKPHVAFERHCALVSAALATIKGVNEVRWEEYKS
jgi:hypothetical protein